jgi:hypothetical protein
VPSVWRGEPGNSASVPVTYVAFLTRRRWNPERRFGAGRYLCARVCPPAPYPRQGTLVTSRMEVRCPRSSYHAGRGHQVLVGRRPIIKIPFSVLVWPNLLLKESNLEPFISANFRHGPDVFAGDRGEGMRGSAAWLSSPFALKLCRLLNTAHK